MLIEMKNSPAITLCNNYGRVHILFKDEHTLTDFAKSVANVAPVIAQALNLQETAVTTHYEEAVRAADHPESSFMSDSVLSELSASFLSTFSDIEANEGGFGWEFIDN